MADDYFNKQREGMKDSIKYPVHYIANYSHYGKDNLPKKEEIKIQSRRSKDDSPQDYDSKKKVKILNKRRIIRKNLNNII